MDARDGIQRRDAPSITYLDEQVGTWLGSDLWTRIPPHGIGRGLMYAPIVIF